MKKSKLFVIIGGVLLLILGIIQIIRINLLISSQDLSKNDSAKYIILKSKLDGEDMSKMDVERGGVILFEFTGKTLTQMSNISEVDNCESFGEVNNYQSDTTYISAEKYKLISTSFSWNYKNDYDSATGTAMVKFKEKTSAYGTDFVLHMYIEKTGEIIEYSGYRYGTLDPAVLKENIW
jgi:hypothetical protein